MRRDELADVGELYAFHTQGLHILLAQGHKPTPCHAVQIRQRPERILPPLFEVIWHRASDPCIEVVTPYVAYEEFRIGPRQDSLRVYTFEGERDVPVLDLPVLGSVAAVRPSPGEPSRLGSIVVSNAESPSSLRGLFAGGERMQLALAPASREAVGYSDDFSFEEAFERAVAALPGAPTGCCYLFERVEVVYVGAEIGGFTNAHRMVVRVRA